MRKLLIVESDEPLRSALVEQLRRNFDITVCGDGETALELMRTQRPDAMILDLMLPVKDGLCVLEESAEFRPPVVLCLSDFFSPYMFQTLQDLGVNHSLRKPCYPRVVAGHILRLVDHIPDPNNMDGQAKVTRLLLELRFNAKADGYRFLKVGIPLFSQDPQQRVCK